MPSTLSNPLRLGLRQERVISPQCLVIFGASGDLTHRKLIPALFELYLQRRIPSEFGIVGCARRPWNDNEFREKMKIKLSTHISGKEREWENFSHSVSLSDICLDSFNFIFSLNSLSVQGLLAQPTIPNSLGILLCKYSSNKAGINFL